MNLIWALINDLSFLVSLALISIPIPGIASSIQSLLSTLFYLDLLMTDQWLPIEKSVTEGELEEDSALNLLFESQGFQSRIVLLNLGSSLVFLVIQVMLLLYTFLMKVLSSVSLIAKKQFIFLEGRLLWGGTIRFIIQQFQPFIFSSFINITSTSLSDLQTQSLGLRFNFYLSAIIFAGTLFSIIVFYSIIISGKAEQSKYSTLIDGLKSDRRGFAQYWTIWTLVKWSLMCFVLILLKDCPALQVQLLTLLSIFSTMLQFKVQPMDCALENAICLFNELMATFYLYVLISLAIAGEDTSLRENLGLSLISILLFALFVNVMKVIIQIIIDIVKKIIKKWCSNTRVVWLRRQQVSKDVYRVPRLRLESNVEGLVREGQINKTDLNSNDMPQQSRRIVAQDVTLQELI
ncbi:hypothetical protein FGO68_gene1328 [Halteria grandinella]|uniref:TRP C-terminal domain-containing protein n=1 Tax=Halteria grandinella TaxID=5974 RepID=A0A8J8TAC2_HALGN|nr:hypothetical protein FGO68_gene1328 [Halteria grandinella]